MKEIEISFLPGDNDSDEIVIKIAPEMRDFLKRAVVAPGARKPIYRLFNREYARERIKSFIPANFDVFCFLWDSELIENLERKTEATYSDYVELIKRINDSDFQTMINEIANYERQTFTINVSFSEA